MFHCKRLATFALMASGCAPLAAQISNAASYALPGFPISGIAQGSIFVIFRLDLRQAQLVQATSFPLPKQLAGTSVRVTVQGTSADALMLYTSVTQVAAILPSATPVGKGTLVLAYQGEASDPQPIEVVGSSFGIFTLNQAGTGPGILQNVNSALDRPVNSIMDVARPTQTMIIWGTGLGPVSGDEGAGPLPGNMNLSV